MSEQTKPEFQNSSYFILPLKIDNPYRLSAFLRNSSNWEEKLDAFELQYLMFYAREMTDPEDERFRMYRYKESESLRIYLFDDNVTDPGKAPTLGDISLYVFGKEISFLEFQVFYNEMDIKGILQFISSFRGLRNPKEYPEGSDSIILRDAVKKILPAEDSGTVLCFSNPSEYKTQANIFTMYHNPQPSNKESNKSTDQVTKKDNQDKENRSICCRLAHGYKSVIPSDEDAARGYDKCLHLNTSEYWGICPDGIAYVKRSRPSQNNYENLRKDFHFMYLLLLNQRFAAISFIEAINECSRNEKARKGITDVYRRVVELRTRYSFRVISDDFFVQTVYSTGYQVLEIDALLKDLEDANGQFNELSRVSEKRVEHFVIVVSLLAAVSAFADLAAYREMFRSEHPPYGSLLLIPFLALVFICIFWSSIKRKLKLDILWIMIKERLRKRE